jgi:hypothetical protein
MTAVATAPDDGRMLVRPVELGRRRPVLSLLGVIVAIALVLLAGGRSGVLAPQAELEALGSLGDGMTFYAPAYAVANHGWRPIEVDIVRAPGAVHVAGPDVDLLSTEAYERTDIDDLPVFAPMTVAGGDHRTLVVAVPCVDEVVRPIELVVRVRSVDTGLARTLRVDLGDGLFCA